jgi:hypothetical protein
MTMQAETYQTIPSWYYEYPNMTIVDYDKDTSFFLCRDDGGTRHRIDLEINCGEILQIVADGRAEELMGRRVYVPRAQVYRAIGHAIKLLDDATVINPEEQPNAQG